MTTIRFKSTPDNFRKEYLGLKQNTVRRKDEQGYDVRYEVLNEFIDNKIDILFIEIENSISHEFFTRKVTDITIFENMYIISWRQE